MAHHVRFELVEDTRSGVPEVVVDAGLQKIVAEDVVVVAVQGQAEVGQRTSPVALTSSCEVSLESSGTGILFADVISIVSPQIVEPESLRVRLKVNAEALFGKLLLERPAAD